MTNSDILDKTRRFIQDKFEQESTGHDWWHIERVVKTALMMAREEKANLFIVELGALLHDIADYKFHGGDEAVGGKEAAKWLKSLNVEEDIIKQVVHIVDNVSFKGTGEAEKMKSLEGKIVQDADRLDALGAIGIARAFAYGGSKGRPIYNPEGDSRNHLTFEEYKKGADSTFHHFDEKLFHIKDRMHTKTGKKIAKERHAYMKDFIKRFLSEWEATS